MTITRNRRRVIVAAAAALSVLTLLSACGGNSANALQENEDGTVSITIATVASDSGSQAFYAEKQGFFEDQGLDVTVDIVANVPELAASVESGDAQFALTSPTSVSSAVAGGLDFKIVAGGAIYTQENPGTYLMVPKGSDIDSVEDLAGKSIAVNALNTMPHLSTLATLEDAGVDTSGIKFVTLDFTQVGQAFESGQVDAATVTAPYSDQIKATGIGTSIAVPYDAVNDKQEFLNTIWFGQGSTVEENPDVVKKFQAAIAAANEWANDPANTDARKQILQEYTGLKDQTLKGMELLEFADLPTEELIAPVIAIMDRFDVLPKKVEPSDIIADVN